MQRRLRNLRLILANERRRKRAGKQDAPPPAPAIAGRPALRLVSMNEGQTAEPGRRPAALRLVWDFSANREAPRHAVASPVGLPLRS